MLNIRTTDEQDREIARRAEENGFETVSAYVKYVALNATVTATVPKVKSLRNMTVGVRKDGSIKITINGEEVEHGKVKETLRQIAKENGINIESPAHRTDYNTRELGNIIIKELK